MNAQIPAMNYPKKSLLYNTCPSIVRHEASGLNTTPSNNDCQKFRAESELDSLKQFTTNHHGYRDQNISSEFLSVRKTGHETIERIGA